MGRTSSTVKDRYNKKAYDSLLIRIPKGQKEQLQAHAEESGESLNAFIQRAIRTQLQQDREQSGGKI